MFDLRLDGMDSVVGLLPGERPEAEDRLAYEVTCRELADEWVESDRHLLPDDLEEMPVGLFLAAVVSTVDPAKLNGHHAVRLMQARARLSSHHDAGKYRAMAEVAFSPPGDADSPVEREPVEIDYAAAEVAAALTLTRRASRSELDLALSLSDRLQRVLQFYSEGRVDIRKVRVFERQLGHLPDDTVDTVLDRTLDDAFGMTTGPLQHRVSKQVMVTDPDGAASSFREGLEDRKVTSHANPDFTGSLHILNGHPDEVAAARANIERLARSLKTGDEERTLDQLRNDVALDLLRGGRPDGSVAAAGVHITIPATTLLELSDEPGDLGGFGPVIAEIARKTVAENVDGEWTFTVTDQGRPVATGTLARRPTASQTRQVAATYTECVMVGCRQPAVDCDLDHRRPSHQGGQTQNDNLAPLCRYHHMIRHHVPWRYERLPNGDHHWTSPLGHTYVRRRGPPET